MSLNLLNKDLTTVDTSRDVMVKGPMRFRLTDLKVVDTKDKKKQMLEFTFKSEYPSKSTRGGDLKPGYEVKDRIIITETPDRGEDKIEKALAIRRQQLTGSQSGAFAPIEQYIGVVVDAMVDIEDDETGEYGPQNRLRKITKV